MEDVFISVLVLLLAAIGTVPLVWFSEMLFGLL